MEGRNGAGNVGPFRGGGGGAQFRLLAIILLAFLGIVFMSATFLPTGKVFESW